MCFLHFLTHYWSATFWSLQLRDGCECGEGRGCFDAYKVAGTCSRSWKEARLCRPSSSGKSLTCLSIMWFSTWNILSLDTLSMLILMEFKLMPVVSTNADYLLLIYSGLIGTNLGCVLLLNLEYANFCLQLTITFFRPSTYTAYWSMIFLLELAFWTSLFTLRHRALGYGFITMVNPF